MTCQCEKCDRSKKRIAEIKERLEKATSGPWALCELTNDGIITKDGHVFIDVFDSGSEAERFNDAKFIANAPADIKFLLEAVESYKLKYRLAFEKLKLIKMKEYRYHCSGCGIFTKFYSNSCPGCGREGYLSGSFRKEDLEKWYEENITEQKQGEADVP